MPSQLKTFLVVVLLGLAIAGGYFIGKSMLPSAENETAVNSCPIVMADIIESSKGSVYAPDDAEDVDDKEYAEPETHYLVKYSVSGDELTNPALEEIPFYLKDEQVDITLQEESWEIFSTLIPVEDRQMVAQYNIFTDGYSNTLAAVDQTPDDLTQWIVEIDVADLDDKNSFIFTLVHEYAHLLTLDSSQASVDEEIYNDPTNLELLESKAAACPNYFTGAGCSYADSYINAFYNRFWVEVNDEWQAIDKLQYEDDITLYYEGLYNFYLTHQDQFVDDYATTHPAEDIAESFTYFVFSPKPTGDSVIDQKILFFYEYPELVELRQYILDGTCSTIQ